MKNLYNTLLGRVFVEMIPSLDIDSALCLAIERDDIKAAKKIYSKRRKNSKIFTCT